MLKFSGCMMLPLSFRKDFTDSLERLKRLSFRFKMLEDGTSSGDSVLLPGSGSSSLGRISCVVKNILLIFYQVHFLLHLLLHYLSLLA